MNSLSLEEEEEEEGRGESPGLLATELYRLANFILIDESREIWPNRVRVADQCHVVVESRKAIDFPRKCVRWLVRLRKNDICILIIDNV